MSTDLGPELPDMPVPDRIARVIIIGSQNGGRGLDKYAICNRASVSVETFAQTRKEWKAALRDLGFNCPRPTYSNDWRYFATMDDGERRRGDRVRWSDMLSRTEEWILDLEQSLITLTNENPVDTQLATMTQLALAQLRSQRSTLQALVDYVSP